MRLYVSVLAIGLLFGFTGCFKVIRQGEVGVKRTLGKLKTKHYASGLHPINPFTDVMIKVPVRTLNLPVTLESLPSKEGLNVQAEFSVLYHIRPEAAVKIVETLGIDEGEEIIRNVLRSAAANVTAKHDAKGLHTAERAEIGQDIAEIMTKLLGDRGLVIEAILLKSIRLPDGLYNSIEEKMRAEQDAQRMEYVLMRERKEAERRIIEATGIRDAQRLINDGLNEQLLRYQSIEAFKELSQSPNAKVIVTDGKAPMILNPGQ
jgi:regulator of protease activity HflC (stomatin/prohibitin superfamily)